MKNGLAYCEIALRNRTSKQAFTYTFFPSLTVAAVDALQTLFRVHHDLVLVKLGPHTKFSEDWSNGLAVHWIQTDRQLDKYILDTPVSFKNILYAIPARHFPKVSIAERNLLR